MGKNKLFRMIGLLLLLIGGWFVINLFAPLQVGQSKDTGITIELAVYSGNTWGVPQKYAYEIYDQAIALFEAKYAEQNIKIKLRSGIMIQSYSEWLAEKVLLGEEADVFLVLEEDLSTYAAIGLLENLSPYMAQSADFSYGDFYQKALESGQYNHEQYALPFQIAPTFLVVNKTLLQDNNVSIDPNHWTWEDFYQICKALTRDTDGDNQLDQFGVFDYDWEKAFYTNDSALFPSDGGAIAFKDEPMIETIDFMKKMYSLNQGTNPASTLFDKGKIAFKTFTLPEYRAYATYPYRILKYENFEWEALPYPVGPRGNSSSKLYSLQLGMSSRSNNKKWAFEFIKFLTTDYNVQHKVWEDTYALPVLRPVVEEIYVSDNPEVTGNRIVGAQFLEEVIEHSYFDPHFKSYARLKSLMDQKLFQIIAQNKESSSELSILKKELNKLMHQS